MVTCLDGSDLTHSFIWLESVHCALPCCAAVLDTAFDDPEEVPLVGGIEATEKTGSHGI